MSMKIFYASILLKKALRPVRMESEPGFEPGPHGHKVVTLPLSPPPLPRLRLG